MSTDLITALKLVDEMRQRGVTKFTVGDVSAEFAPAEVKMPTTKPVDEDMCKCGHSLSVEHMNGVCIAVGGGCDPRACSPEPEK